MQLAEIGAATTPANPDIRRRMASSTKARSTKHYVANHDGVEVGFVAVDAIPEADYLVLYELFVIERFRGSGLGALLLAEVERFANILGYERVILFPKPLEPPFPAERLVAWYKRNGYSERSDCPSELEKTL
ncbi:GNAT family N-acetyltransferase [Bradyrhizobium sp. 27S5]|uniref:GNAT family N-acetyltransferase n=1 Tax=Bradyrhizobium sp. 27S5 TaxID=3139728 RepID=UPI0030D38A18